MNVILAVKNYVTEMIKECGPGMKILLLDKETMGIVSMVYMQSEILQKEVFLFERLDTKHRDQMKHMKCICFLRPNSENLSLLSQELRDPKYCQYFIYFSNTISKQELKTLAEADEQEVVREIQEYYADYIPIGPHTFVTNTPHSIRYRSWHSDSFKRTVQGLTSVLLSLRKSPSIRYQNNSEFAKLLADGVKQVMVKETALFEFRKEENSPLLLILDRRDDCITPLLNQWTYQSMTHELLGINNNRVDLSSVPGVSKDLQQIILSIEHDDFYAKNIYLNYGEIGSNIKGLLDMYQEKTKNQAKLDTISDMKTFIETYPAFKKMAGATAKHFTLVSELYRLVDKQNKMLVSECEQEMVSGFDHQGHLLKIREILNSRKVSADDCLRLVMVYALRYEKQPNNAIAVLTQMLIKMGISPERCKMVQNIIDYGGQRVRGSDLFKNETPIALTKKFLKVVENIYTQHKPLLADILLNLSRRKLKENAFPYILNNDVTSDRPQDIIVFIVGGITYEESLAVQNFNVNSTSHRAIVGGNSMLNMRCFLDEVSMTLDGKKIATS